VHDTLSFRIDSSCSNDESTRGGADEVKWVAGNQCQSPTGCWLQNPRFVWADDGGENYFVMILRTLNCYLDRIAAMKLTKVTKEGIAMRR
jgi:hypothetical protein